MGGPSKCEFHRHCKFLLLHCVLYFCWIPSLFRRWVTGTVERRKKRVSFIEVRMGFSLFFFKRSKPDNGLCKECLSVLLPFSVLVIFSFKFDHDNYGLYYYCHSLFFFYLSFSNLPKLKYGKYYTIAVFSPSTLKKTIFIPSVYTQPDMWECLSTMCDVTYPCFENKFFSSAYLCKKKVVDTGLEQMIG